MAFLFAFLYLSHFDHNDEKEAMLPDPPGLYDTLSKWAHISSGRFLRTCYAKSPLAKASLNLINWTIFLTEILLLSSLSLPPSAFSSSS